MTGSTLAEHPDELYARYRSALAGRSLPQAFVDLDRFETNARALLVRAGDRPIRVASKSVRCVGLLSHLRTLSPRFAGVMCFTAPEALHLAAAGFDDLLVAYPTVDPAHLADVAAAVDAGHHVTLLVDSAEHVEHLERHLPPGAPVPVAIDLDLSWDLPGLRFGVLRSPTDSADAAALLAARVATSPRLQLDGIVAYEAQVAGVAERAPGRSRAEQAVIVALKRRSLVRIARRRAAAVAAIERTVGHPLRVVNAGGTGSLESSARERVVTEVTAGSGLLAPALFDHYDAFEHLPAAGYAVPVVRHPAPGVVTCLGGGYVASGAVGPDKAPVVWAPAGARLTALEGAGEVQTPVLLPAGVHLDLGDPVVMRHAKAGELCERFASLLVIRGDRVVDELPTYRGEGATFL
ncbi:alanine racemase [Nitriliruptor alkaliphilus]|uniref:alanine racemase n=1 Tax=Nitriliruptor alkaliphilus TaxID=427918 RepID=UPI000B1F7367|nr:alanine racemase [Nitriliruptor alkaliphilus]